jgi:hypothetical protein
MREFVDVIQAVAWPIATITIALLLKDHLDRLLGRLAKIKLKGVSAEFRDSRQDSRKE